MCVIVFVVAQINFTAIDRACVKICNLPPPVVSPASHVRICSSAVDSGTQRNVVIYMLLKYIFSLVRPYLRMHESLCDIWHTPYALRLRGHSSAKLSANPCGRKWEVGPKKIVGGWPKK